MNEESKKIVERVKKLLALANNSAASEGERENAMRMAYAMLAKHNLDESALETDEERVGEKMDIVDAVSPWTRRIAKSLAKLYFCNYFINREYVIAKKRVMVYHNFIGKASNVTSTKLMTEYVVKSLQKEARTVYKDSSSRTAFVSGAAATIVRRIEEMIKLQENDVAVRGNGTSVILKSVYDNEKALNDAWSNEKYGKMQTKAARHNRVDAGAFNAGKSFGNNVGLNTQVASGKQVRIGR